MLFRDLQVRNLRGHHAALNLFVIAGRRNFVGKCSLPNDVVCSQPNNRRGFYDVVIAGGGMVGSAMACALGASPKFADKRVLLLDAKPLKSGHKLTPTYSNRVSALSPKSRTFMEDLGVWNNICGMRQRPVKFMHVWDACSDAAVLFTPSDRVDDNIVYLVENNVTISAVLKRLNELGGGERVVLRDGIRVRNYEIPTNYDEGLVKLHLEDGEVIETDLLIGSDGASSTVRKTAKIRTIGWDYNQLSVVATLHLAPETNDNSVAWQRFLPNSTIAILPLTDTLSSLVWTAEVQLAKRLMSLPDDEFVAAINSALLSNADMNHGVASLTKSLTNILQSVTQSGQSARQVLPKVSGIDAKSRGSYKVRMGHATQYVAPRVALIGDAVHQVHPHAGQGANLGFGDVQCLRKILDEAVSCGSDIGSMTHLVKYERERQREVVPIIVAIDVLHRQFTTDWYPMVAFRGLALSALNSCQPVKDFLMSNVN